MIRSTQIVRSHIDFLMKVTIDNSETLLLNFLRFESSIIKHSNFKMLYDDNDVVDIVMLVT